MQKLFTDTPYELIQRFSAKNRFKVNTAPQVNENHNAKEPCTSVQLHSSFTHSQGHALLKTAIAHISSGQSSLQAKLQSSTKRSEIIYQCRISQQTRVSAYRERSVIHLGLWCYQWEYTRTTHCCSLLENTGRNNPIECFDSAKNRRSLENIFHCYGKQKCHNVINGTAISLISHISFLLYGMFERSLFLDGGKIKIG